jgi:signal transduction histidine kinase
VPGTDRKHLIIVDDEPVILQILSAVFEDSPWRVSTCSGGREALQLMQSEGVDLLVTDKNLPDVSGLELLRAARELNDLAEVIVITGYGSLETAITAMELDAFDYVLKPLNNVFDIRRKVQRASEKQDIAAENRRLVKELATRNSELERALRDAKELQQELIQSEKLAGIGTLAAGIAHEISSPLFGIMGLAEAVVDEDEIALCHEHAREIVAYSQSIKDIVVELSSYSRASANEYLTTVELSRVVADAVRLVQRSADTEGVGFTVCVGPGTYLNARTNEIQQVFVNLIKNAVEACRASPMDRPAQVTVEVGHTAESVWARVSDNGPGIAKDKLGLVFDPFYTTKAPGEGTGLGLNIVYRIAAKYRGNVTVESALGERTTFSLKFPVDRS